MAAVINDQSRAAGRTGMGAVMGSKRLKAISVSGNTGPALADEASFKEYARQSYRFLKDNLKPR